MSLSNWINQHGMLVTSIAVAGLVIAALVTVLRPGGDDMSRYSYRYFYDLNTGEIVVDDNTKIPPILSVSGGDVVGAIMIGCGACDNRDDMKLGWLEKYTDEAKQMIQVGTDQGPDRFTDESGQMVVTDQMAQFREVMDRDHLLAQPPAKGEQPQWVSEGYPEGQYVISQAMRNCAGSGKRARVCSVTEDDLP